MENIEYDERDMDSLEEKLYELKRLKQKYQMNCNELKEFASTLEEKIQMLENIDMARKDLEKSFLKAKGEVLRESQALFESRKKGAEKLEKYMEKELKDLSIKNGKFHVHFDERESEGIALQTADFYIQTNVGDSVKPLAEITSSGEVSRVMLALKKIFSDIDKIPILIFDEIDSNIGGETVLVVCFGCRIACGASVRRYVRDGCRYGDKPSRCDLR